MRVFPAVHYSMGGIWVGYKANEKDGFPVVGDPANQQTNVPGVFAGGEADNAYHGANRLGANSLLSCIYGGIVAGPAIASSVRNLPSSSFDLKSSALAARATLEAALERRETRGCHNRSDYPDMDPALQVNLVWSSTDGITREPISPVPDEIAALMEDVSADGKLGE